MQCPVNTEVCSEVIKSFIVKVELSKSTESSDNGRDSFIFLPCVSISNLGVFSTGMLLVIWLFISWQK